MASVITHIALTEKVFDKFFKDKTKKDFFIGTSFPDIRYLGVIERDKTHYDNLSVNNLKDDNSFLAGAKFHSVVDDVWMDFMAESNVYSLCPESEYASQSLKVFADEVFYRRIKDLNTYTEYLNEILPAEREYGIAEKDLKKWHSLLRRYFRNGPKQEFITDFSLVFDLSKKMIDEINKNLAAIHNNRKIVDILEDFYNNFESILKE